MPRKENLQKKPARCPFERKFGLTRKELESALEHALIRGGEFSEIFLEYRVHHAVNMEEGLIKDTTESISVGAGVRVLFGEQTGYAYTSDLTLPQMKRAAVTAASIAKTKNGPRHPGLKLSKAASPYNLYPVLRPAHEARVETKIALVQKAYASALGFSPLVIKAKVSLVDDFRFIRVVNSEGLDISDAQPMLRLACLCIAEKNGRREAGFSGGGGRVGLEFFKNRLSPESIGKEAAQEAVDLLEAVPPPAGEMPVVLAPGHSGVLIHEAVGHLLEADFHRRKTSIFWDKMGKKVANEQIHIFDDPTLAGFRGSYNIDDEGTVPQKTPLIRSGQLVGLLQDRLSARILRMPLTGHGRRQDYASIPIPRMSNTYIERGEYDPGEIIRSVRRGFYAQRFQGGQVEDTGKFTFSVSSGFLIEDGKRTVPVKQATLIGTNIDILKNVERVGSDLAFGLQTGTCGKEGQAAPVSDGCPTLKIRRMTVGGIL